MSIASLVLGVSSIFFGFTFLVPLIGLILGFVGKRNEPAGRGMALAGIWINAIILGFWVAVTVFFVLAIVGGLLTIPFWMTFS